MKIKLESRKGLTKIKACAANVQKILDLIDGEEINKQHYPLILQHYTLTNTFTSTAERYGMLIRIVGQGRQPNAVWAKTHNYPEFEVPPLSAEQLLQIANKGRGRGTRRAKPADDSAHAWNRSPRRPSQRKAKAASEPKAAKVAAPAKQAKASTTDKKPQFNHSITPPMNPNDREPNTPSRMRIMNVIEDLGGYKHHMHQPQTTGRVFSKGRY